MITVAIGSLKMSYSSDFKVIREIIANHDLDEIKELSAYINEGWSLVDIYHLDYIDPQTRESERVTIFVVGHTDANAVPPKWK
jgi:hypothetical protein